MKPKSKLFTAVLIGCALVLAFTACAGCIFGEDPIVGYWVDDAGATSDPAVTHVLEFTADNRGTQVKAYPSQNIYQKLSFTWKKLDDDKYDLDDGNVLFTIASDKKRAIATNNNDGYSTTFSHYDAYPIPTPYPTNTPAVTSTIPPYPTSGPNSVGGHILTISDVPTSDSKIAASILMETDESKVAEMMESMDNKYVVLDYATGNNYNLGIMPLWLGKTIGIAKDYYSTLAFRLYNLIGSPSPSYDIPALQHFRFIYDFPQYSYFKDYQNDEYVPGTTRIFEYVKGAVIKGKGTISTTLTTNTGLTTTYEQTSVDGKFVVPYATGTNGGITAAPYTIKGTGQTFTVTEDQVLNGETVN